MSHHMAKAKIATPAAITTQKIVSPMSGAAESVRVMATPAIAAAPTATVIGTMNRRQCTQIATAVASAMPAVMRAPIRDPASGNNRNAAANKVKAKPPAKLSKSNMLGRAIRRTRVKYSASPQDASVTSIPARTVGLPESRPPLISCPSQPTATSRMTLAIATKMSLNPVSKRKCSSSTKGLARLSAAWLRNASAASWLMAPASTAACRSLSLYIALSQNSKDQLHQLYYHRNTLIRTRRFVTKQQQKVRAIETSLS